ncbi:hypothetical protein ASPWEDRAFT_117492 [Aspergillus wentii DTO 134E9]|uniref:F-box domain-containing protein n=1 Tax=Aspergillus wentii DTO 134E9 TaxID=1073089 RepID=A0A1L9RAP6_ASPWE|nr:uncharacterized protein ASPWEDRAFT_117492 [Aspergillus wentii DTO 134E9]OJJ31927.1 hypothetical protein ASPWEDRAFT_117492 [Aspergillus wentii DTO 134E9]
METSTKTIPKTKHSPILPTLPLEIIEMICDELNTRDLASLVGSCRDAYRLTINCFAERYTEVYLDFSEHSLNHLHAIASNKVMREYVQRLVVMTPEPYLGGDIPWQWSAAGHVKNALNMPLIQRFRDDLAERLVNCRSFIISPVVGDAPAKADDQKLNPDDVAGILLDVIADASLPMKLFWYGKGMNYTSEVMNIKRLPKSLFSHPGFKTAWASLENLHLEHELTPYNYSFLMDLILHAPNLRKLYLSLGPKDLAMEFFSDLSRSYTLNNLERVALSFTAIQADDLIRILHQSRHSLKRLILEGVTGLTAGWLTVLHKMQAQFPRLESIELNMLYGAGEVVLFTAIKNYPEQKNMFTLRACDQPCEGMGIEKSDIIGVTYTGPEMGTALEVLLKVQQDSMS